MKNIIKNYRNDLFIVYLAFFLIACGSERKPVQPVPEIDFSVDAVKTGTLKIPLDSVTSNNVTAFQTLSKNGANYFTFLNYFNNSIYYYNLETQAYDSIQQFPEEGPNGLGKFESTTRYEFLGDSIMFYSRGTLQLNIVNKKKDVVFKYNFGKEGKIAPYGMMSGWIFRTDIGFNFSAVARTPYVVMNDLPDSLEFGFSLETKEVENKYNPLPVAYQNEIWMLEQLRYNRAENKKLRVYSYPIDPYIHIRQQDGSFSSKYFGSKIVKPVVPIASIKIAQDLQTAGQYYFGQGRYEYIYYDPFRKVFLRSAYSGMYEDLVDINNRYGDTTSFDKVFIIGDDELSIKGELKNDRMREHVVFFQENGIHILVETNDEDLLTFDIYDIVEK